jgi:hypothetical protein
MKKLDYEKPKKMKAENISKRRRADDNEKIDD